MAEARLEPARAVPRLVVQSLRLTLPRRRGLPRRLSSNRPLRDKTQTERCCFSPPLTGRAM